MIPNDSMPQTWYVIDIKYTIDDEDWHHYDSSTDLEKAKKIARETHARYPGEVRLRDSLTDEIIDF